MATKVSIMGEALLLSRGSSNAGEGPRKTLLGAFGRCVEVAIFMPRSSLVISNVRYCTTFL
jgi:hypothetical protein